MSSPPPDSQPNPFAVAFGAALLAVLAAIGIAARGSGTAGFTPSATGRGGVTVTVPLGITRPAIPDRDLRELVLEAWRNSRPVLRTMFENDPSPVPVDTGFLRFSFNAYIDPDGTTFVMEWTAPYAAYLVEQGMTGVGPSGRPVSREGLHPGTEKNWLPTAVQMALPVVLNDLRNALAAAGLEVEVTIS